MTRTSGSRRLVAGAWLAGVCVLVGLGRSAAAETLTYVLEPQPATGQLRVTLTWETAGRTTSTLCTAQHWGSVTDVPALLRQVRFEGVSAGSRNGAAFVLTHRAGAVVRGSYVVVPGRRTFDWSCTHHPITTETFFHGIGNTFLLAPADGGGMPTEYEVVVQWKLPPEWDAVCSWGSGRAVGARLKVEEFRNAVYLAGDLVRRTRSVAGAGQLTVAMPVEFRFTPDTLADMAADVLAAECKLTRETAFPAFVVTAIPVGAERTATSGGTMTGLGLTSSLALFLPPETDATDTLENLLAHELFHFWNGKLLKAAEPTGEVLWFTEGLTDYYGLRCLFESGRWPADTYAKWLNRHLRAYQANPARNASNAEIAARGKEESRTYGEVAYQRGLLLGLRWHRLARSRGLADGLDRLTLELLRRARTGGVQISNATLRDVGVETLGGWFGEEFDRYVIRAETIDLPADVLAPALVAQQEQTAVFELGFDRERSLSSRRVRGLRAGSTAAAAGLREGDELVGWKIGTEPDEQVEIQVRRDGQQETVRYLPRGVVQQVTQFRPG